MDNLAIYADGHKHCFSCGHHVKANGLEVLRNVYEEKMVVKDKTPYFPADAESTSFDTRAVQWLGKYGITRREMLENKMKWSKSRELLIFPFYGDRWDLLGWQGRCFKDGWQKYYTSGNSDDIFWLQQPEVDGVVLPYAEERGIIVVEDVVSAIKVGRHAASMPLLGSNFSATRRIRMKHLTPSLIFWLDYDKAKEAYRYSQECQVLGYDTKVIVTEEDPKCYNDAEITAILEGVNY